jgi:replication-associated recombination protein RarA
MADSDNLGGLALSAKNEAAYPDDYFLLTSERSAKLDLLIHLLTHLSSSIVICGPKGIGKTTLLKALQQRLAAWNYCVLTASPEQDMASLNAALAASASTAPTLLVMDNAGSLTPGFIAAILREFADHRQIRVIFALTPDELYLKNSSDSLISECSVIEIPPLSEKQCGEFLQYLAARPDRRVAPQHLNDTVTASMYRNTHGIPGNIIAALPSVNRRPQQDKTLILLIAAVLLLVAITLGVQWLSQTNRLTFSHPTESNQTTP